METINLKVLSLLIALTEKKRQTYRNSLNLDEVGQQIRPYQIKHLSNKVAYAAGRVVEQAQKRIVRIPTSTYRRLQNVKLSAEVVKQITQQVPHLSIQKCEGDWEGFFDEMGKKRLAEKLWLNYSHIGDNEVRFITRNYPNLKELCFGNNDITDEGAILIGTILKHLTLLNINCNKLTDYGGLYIVLNLTNLRELFMYDNKLTKEGKWLIKSFCQRASF